MLNINFIWTTIIALIVIILPYVLKKYSKSPLSFQEKKELLTKIGENESIETYNWRLIKEGICPKCRHEHTKDNINEGKFPIGSVGESALNVQCNKCSAKFWYGGPFPSAHEINWLLI